ncbi:5,10-methylenetetrahydromethanopterin reductase [Archaeoglobus sp.]
MELGVEILPDKPHYEIEYIAILAEKNGFDYIWLTEHYNNRNPYPLLSTIAFKTYKAKIGVGVTNPYTMHPALTASTIMTIDEISDGRAVLGISAGDKVTLESLGIKREKPLKYVREAVEVIRQLMSGKPVSYKGEVFKVNGRMNFTRQVPIYVGAQGEKMIRLALEIGDGILLNVSKPEDAKIKTDKKVAVCCSVCVDDDIEKAKRLAKIVVGFIIAGSSKKFLERKGIEPEKAEEIRVLISKGKFGEIQIEDEILSEFCIYGTVSDVVAEIERFDVDQFIVGSPIGRDKVKVIKELGKRLKS